MWVRAATAALAGALLSAALPGRALAQDARDLMGRAQNQSEQRAVEDLIRKLQGQRQPASQAEPKAAPSNAPAKPPAVTAKLPPAPPKATPAPVEEPAPLGKPVEPAAAASAPVTPATPPAVTIATPPSPAVVPAPPVTVEPPRVELPPAPTSAAPVSPASATPPVPPAPPRPLPAIERAPEIAQRESLPSVDIEVFFPFASAEITPQAAAVLAPLGRALQDGRLAAATFLIAGHTDAKGRPDYNQRLSELRAQSVRAHLIRTFGIAEHRLIARGFGESRLKNPRAPGADENRRVQVINWTSQLAR